MTSKERAQELCNEADAHRKAERWGEAMTCYMEAARLDADSPATEALKMLSDIMSFRCNDLYNP